jgi:hypothetical protein
MSYLGTAVLLMREHDMVHNNGSSNVQLSRGEPAPRACELLGCALEEGTGNRDMKIRSGLTHPLMRRSCLSRDAPAVAEDGPTVKRWLPFLAS